MKPASSTCICLLVVSLLVVASCSAVAASPSEAGKKARKASTTLPDEEFLARLCEQQRGHPATMRRLPWCQRLHATSWRRGGVPMPPPGGDGEEIDARYGVSKRLVPTGPNPLHH